MGRLFMAGRKAENPIFLAFSSNIDAAKVECGRIDDACQGREVSGLTFWKISATLSMRSQNGTAGS